MFNFPNKSYTYIDREVAWRSSKFCYFCEKKINLIQEQGLKISLKWVNGKIRNELQIANSNLHDATKLVSFL